MTQLLRPTVDGSRLSPKQLARTKLARAEIVDADSATAGSLKWHLSLIVLETRTIRSIHEANLGKWGPQE